MSRLIESIRVSDGVPANLALHSARMQRACDEVLHMKNPWDLTRALSEASIPSIGLFKCRVVYDEMSIAISFLPYVPRPVNSLKIVRDNAISYPHKFADRARLENHFRNKGSCDDILIIRDGLVTDSSNANIVFMRDGRWFTPATCLLKGTMREYLMSDDRLTECDIREEDILGYQSFKLINAMLLDQAPVLSIDQIFSED